MVKTFADIEISDFSTLAPFSVKQYQETLMSYGTGKLFRNYDIEDFLAGKYDNLESSENQECDVDDLSCFEDEYLSLETFYKVSKDHNHLNIHLLVSESDAFAYKCPVTQFFQDE
jgi:hypothetical protein